MRAVIDTSVLISGFLSKNSYPAMVIDAWIYCKFVPVVSSPIIEEYTSVILRQKFSHLGSTEERVYILNNLLKQPQVILVHPEENIEAIKEDKKDNMFLECAYAGKTSFIVSGDIHLLKLNKYQKIRIVSAKEFIRSNVSCG